jgi:hypothetical protein
MFAGHADLYRVEIEAEIASAVLAEREACALIAEIYRISIFGVTGPPGYFTDNGQFGRAGAAEAIRDSIVLRKCLDSGTVPEAHA